MLKFVGTGSAFNTKLGNNSAYIKEGNKLFLIDCGSANFHRMKESGLLDDVDFINVFVTHTHADHVGSLADLIFYMYYAKGELKKRVTVYAHENIQVDSFLDMNGVISGEVYEYYPINDDDEDVVVELHDFYFGFLTYQTIHVDELCSYGIGIKNYVTNEHIIYTGDTNELSENFNKVFEEGKLDKLYVDTCSQDYEGNVHLSLLKLSQIINKEHRNKVWCMHLDEKFDVEYAKSLGFNVAEVEI